MLSAKVATHCRICILSLFLSCGDGGELKNDNIAPRAECPRQKCEVERSCKGFDIKSFDTDSLTHCLGLFISKISLLNWQKSLVFAERSDFDANSNFWNNFCRNSHMNTTAIVTKIKVGVNLSEQRISWDARDKTVQRGI